MEALEHEPTDIGRPCRPDRRTFPDRASAPQLAAEPGQASGEAVLSRRDDELPIEEIRDLLGTVRTLYAHRRARGASSQELARIARVGGLLANAIELSSHGVGTVGHRAAWASAEQAVRMTPDLLEVLEPARPLVRAAIDRVRRRRDG